MPTLIGLQRNYFNEYLDPLTVINLQLTKKNMKYLSIILG